jgi:hypothetical protein
MSAPEGLKHVRVFTAPDDGRTVAIYIGPDFDEYDQFPPFLTDEAEIEHIRTAYQLEDPMREIATKAHITDDDWPLQIILLNRDPGGTTLPHYHVPTKDLPAWPTRHQVLICQRGRARVGVLTTGGQALGEVDLEPNSLILLLEGHSVEFREPGTRLIEVKQGPFPGTDADDKVDIPKLVP